MRHCGRIRRAAWVALGTASCALSAGPLLAAPSARLTYERGVGAERCPDETALRRAVEQRLGYDPFFPWANRTLSARIRVDARGLHGEVELLDETGLVLGSRELSAPATQCAELVSGMALAISIAIDPTSVERAPAPRGEADAQPDAAITDWSSARAEEAVSRPATPAVARGAARPLSGRDDGAEPWVRELGAGIVGATGLVPGIALGPVVDVALAKGAWSLGIEGRYLLGLGAELAGASVSSSLLEGALLGCFHLGAPFGCIVGSVGRVAVSAHVAHPSDAAAAVERVGPRVGVDVPLLPQVALRAQVDVAFDLGKQQVQIGSEPPWTSPLVGGVAGISLSGRFP